jgi:HD-GYP domain-containing protein (c-di-GMP phosphodiesterase class II)
MRFAPGIPMLRTAITLFVLFTATAADARQVKFAKRNHGVRLWVSGSGSTKLSVKVPSLVGQELVRAYREGGVKLVNAPRAPTKAINTTSHKRAGRITAARRTQLRIAARLLRGLRKYHPYSMGHVMRVSIYTKEIARALGLTDHKVEQVELAARLHDTGKLTLPRWLLNGSNPKLTPRRLAMIKGHPEAGVKLLEPIGALRSILGGVRSHHENYDGSGYPSLLKGRRIPLSGRIIAVADAFDAMTSSRTYDKAMPVDKAVATLKRLSGTKFDPQVVRCFVEVLAKSGRAQRALRLARHKVKGARL